MAPNSAPISMSVRLIFDSARNQAIDYKRKSAPGRRRGTTLQIADVDQASAIWRSVGGRRRAERPSWLKPNLSSPSARLR
jgi:class 3 adenylate cyclase